MAVKPESFLVLDTSLAGRISRAWIREMQPKLDQIVDLAEDGDFAEARAQASTLDMTGVVSRNRKFIELVGMSAILFGASDIVRPDRSDVASRGKPDVLAKATENMILFIENGLAEAVRKELMAAISEEESEQLAARDRTAKTQTVRKASRIRTLVSATGAGPKALLQQRAMIGASLHTSRLAQWGFLIEADAKGIVEYEVNEELDSRTCPVCETMNGTVFTVEHALERLERLITIDDPEELKAMAPFPSQSADAVKELEDMSTAELQARGLDTPPYHPLCRGRVVRTTNPTVVVGEQSATQVSGPDQPPTRPASPKNDPFVAYEELEDSMRIGYVSDRQKTAVFNYVADDDGFLNNELRFSPRLSRDLEREVSSLDALIAKPESALPRNVTVYRGVENMRKSIGFPEDLTSYTILRDKGYLSTSMSRDKAMQFITQGGDRLPDGTPALMEIFAAKGKKALHIGNVGERSEAELLFGRNSQVKINEIIKDGVDIQTRSGETVKGYLIKAELL